jgi:hypothetical protein
MGVSQAMERGRIMHTSDVAGTLGAGQSLRSSWTPHPVSR